MVYVSDSNLGLSVSTMGTGPDKQVGKLRVIPPGGGEGFILDSANVTVYAEGVKGTLPDGRDIFVTNGGCVLLDLSPEEQDQVVRASKRKAD